MKKTLLRLSLLSVLCMLFGSSTYAADVTATWNFRSGSKFFNPTFLYQNSTGNAELDSDVEGIKLVVDATNGKVDNSGRASNDNAQVNQGSKMTIPAVPGMKIEIANANTDFSTTTIAGSTDYEGTGTKSISYVYEGSDR
jgi:hypothetical protein